MFKEWVSCSRNFFFRSNSNWELLGLDIWSTSQMSHFDILKTHLRLSHIVKEKLFVSNRIKIPPKMLLKKQAFDWPHETSSQPRDSYKLAL